MPTDTFPGFLWPNEGDRLLRPSESLDHSVRFADHEIARHARIWNGYIDAGSVLVEECDRNPEEGPALIYPILFCYRHALEVAMKWFIQKYGHHIGADLEHSNHHDLWLLWNICRRIFEKGSDDRASLQAVERIVKDFHEIDKGSFSFRYAVDKKGVIIDLPSLLLDLKNIKIVMDGIKSFFIGADGLLSSMNYEEQSG